MGTIYTGLSSSGKTFAQGGKLSGDDFYVPGLMDLSGYSLRRTEPDAAWDAFVESSEQGTIFSSSAFLRAAPGRPSLWYCLKNEEVKAAVALTETDDGRSCFHSGLLVYNGILFAPSDPNQGIAQIHSEQFRVTSCVIRDLAETYEALALAAHPSFGDLRAFLWHNFDKPGPKFEAAIRYTSLLALDPPGKADRLEDSVVYARCNKSRRQEIRNGIRQGVVTRLTNDHDLFTALYEKTFVAQGLTVPADELASIRAALANLDDAGALKMFVSSDAAGNPGSIAAFGVDSKRAYYLYGANDPEARSGPTGTSVLWEGFSALSESGVGEMDLEGVNSPRRGYFKLSFGGSITPYHILRLNPA